MKKTVAWVAAILIAPLLLTACAGPVQTRAAEGGFIGAGLGAIAGAVVGGGKGAAVGAAAGALIGGVAGAIAGANEAKGIYAQPQPLPWLTGKSVMVVGSPNYGYGVNITQPVVEDQLRLRGARVVNPPQLQWYQGQPAPSGIDYLVLVGSIEQGTSVTTDVRVLEGQEVRGIGSSRVVYQPLYYYGGYGYVADPRIEALRTGAKNAIWSLH